MMISNRSLSERFMKLSMISGRYERPQEAAEFFGEKREGFLEIPAQCGSEDGRIQGAIRLRKGVVSKLLDSLNEHSAFSITKASFTCRNMLELERAAFDVKGTAGTVG